MFGVMMTKYMNRWESRLIRLQVQAMREATVLSQNYKYFNCCVEILKRTRLRKCDKQNLIEF
jgi:hypothetical protein